MAEQVEGLVIPITTKGVALANAELKQLSKSGGRAEKSTNKLTKSFSRLAVPVAAVAAAGLALNKLVTVGRQFDILNAGLETATGSAENAAVAFGVLEDFAKTTPFTLDQSIDGFTKLVNLGLNPSERALRAYGDTSAALGKSLTQMIEAVADAATGEFERLKEFGIRSKNQGDTIAFTFKGITTVVANNAAAIEGHLISLGENNFAGAMANRMATLDGAISNLEDSWDGLFREINKSPIGDIIEASFRAATDAVEGLTSLIRDDSSDALSQYNELIKPNIRLLESMGIAIANIDPENLENVERILLAAKLNAIDLAREAPLSKLSADMERAAISHGRLNATLIKYEELGADQASDKIRTELNRLESQIKTSRDEYLLLLNAVSEDIDGDVLSKFGATGGDTQDIAAPQVFDLETAEQFGERMSEIAREAYPLATQSALEYGEVQAELAKASLVQADVDAKKLSAIESRFKTEEELLTAKHQRDQEQLLLAHESEAEILFGYNTTKELLEAEHQNNLAMLTKKSEDQRTAITAQAEKARQRILFSSLGAAANIFSGLASLMEKSGKKQSAAQKVLARAGIIASTAQAVMNALAVPPYPLGVALSAGAALQGAIQLSKVGGGSSTSPAVSSPVNQQSQAQPIPPSNVADLPAQQETISIVVQGDIIGGEDTAEKLALLIESYRDRGAA